MNSDESKILRLRLRTRVIIATVDNQVDREEIDTMLMTIIARFDLIKPKELAVDIEEISVKLKHEVEWTWVDCHDAKLTAEFEIQFEELRRCEMTPNEVFKLTADVKEAFSKHKLEVDTLTIVDN